MATLPGLILWELGWEYSAETASMLPQASALLPYALFDLRLSCLTKPAFSKTPASLTAYCGERSQAALSKTRLTKQNLILDN